MSTNPSAERSTVGGIIKQKTEILTLDDKKIDACKAAGARQNSKMLKRWKLMISQTQDL